ncbi:MAG TPA: glycerol-3-phosphate 1-O-acyltransferase PlsY [Armatimonadota bacterium]|nr:glycerol-3-phosphate 1-O-acyltransferase PlsY [Armatimonadota bacterium]
MEAAVLIGSYILGSVPFGLMICKAWRGVDIRKYGSGNIGATNVLRALGPGPAAVVFGADVLKGLMPVALARQLFHEVAWMAVACGMLAVLGHSLSIFLRFRGGKGVATSLGVVVGLDPRVAGIGFGIWLLVVLLSRYVSAASVVASASIPVLMFVFGLPPVYKLFAVIAAAFVIFRHRANVARLLQGKEPRFGEKINVTGGMTMVKGIEGDLLVALARQAVEEFVRFGRVTAIPSPLPSELQVGRGAFICIKKHGQLRGCIGTIEATQPSLAAEVVQNAISAAISDPRFEPVAEDELEHLGYTVDVLSAAEPVSSLSELDPKLYGVIVESGVKRGLLLPDLDGVDMIEEQVGIAMRKAGIRDGEPVSLYRFQVTRHGG